MKSKGAFSPVSLYPKFDFLPPYPLPLVVDPIWGRDEDGGLVGGCPRSLSFVFMSVWP